MFSHLMLGSNDLISAKTFYDAIMQTLGCETGQKDPNKNRIFYFSPESTLCITEPVNGEAATIANGMTVGFNAKNAEQVDAWHKAGIENGGTTCENPPGLRVSGAKQMYLAYLRDPDGNKLCAAYFM